MRIKPFCAKKVYLGSPKPTMISGVNQIGVGSVVYTDVVHHGNET